VSGGAGRIVMHVDLDAFFASVEEREEPSLKGRPLVIGADPRGGAGRGIVATANYPARRFGVRSAMPISTAWRLCPRAEFRRPRFDLYAAASRRVMELLRPEADVFEPAGIDEAYLDVSSRGSFEAARDVAKALRERVRAGERLTVSAGIGPNKLVAKIASDHRKPDGLTVVIPSRVAEFLGPKDASVLFGVGPKTRERLGALACETVADVAALPEERLVREFGSFGRFLAREARGSDDRPVDPAWEQKQVGREVTFERDTGDWEEVLRTLDGCVEEVAGQLAADGHWARTLAVKIRYDGYETHSRQTTLKLPTGRREHMAAGARALVGPFRRPGRRVRLVGFSASGLVPPEDLLPLFP